jgi:hypothetical protein
MRLLTRSWLIGFVSAAMMVVPSGRSDAQPVYSVVDLGRATALSEITLPPFICRGDACPDLMQMNGNDQLMISRRGQNPDVLYWEPGLAAPIRVDGHADDITYGAAISSNGIIVGTSDGGAAVPFKWSRSAGFSSMCCADYYIPLAVNAAGVVVGYRLYGRFQAVIWNNTRDPTFIDDIEIAGGGPWASFDQARTITDDGTITGVGQLTTISGAVEPHYFALIPTPNGSGSGALDRSDWTAVATEQSPDDSPSNALDGNLGTRFSTGRAQHDSQGFSVSWPGDRTIGRIRMEVGPSTGDYPRTCGIWVTDISGNVTFVDCAADAAGTVDVSFAPLAAHTIEVWQWGTAGSWWSIAEFNAYRP